MNSWRRLDFRRCKSKYVVVLAMSFFTAVVWLAFMIGNDRSDVSLDGRPTRTFKTTRSRKQVFTKQFLAWTTKSGRTNWIPNNLRSLGCEIDTCRITEDRSKLGKSEVVIFHSKDVDIADLPEVRPTDQVWVYLNHEPPTQTGYAVVQRLSPLVNLTVSYRRDSDIFAPVYELQSRTQSATESLNTDKRNRKLVTWLVSHCKTSSNREGYVKKLKQFIDVDVWGKCGKNYTRCPKLGREECYRKLAEEYKFYLAFENSLCKDYVSEKLYLAMYAGMVPVVFGVANYSLILPPNSFINALDFEGPFELAQFLLKVGRDTTLYESYLQWRERFTVVQRRYRWLCDLCEQVNVGLKEPYRRRRLTKWWFEDAKCKVWSEQLMQ